MLRLRNMLKQGKKHAETCFVFDQDFKNCGTLVVQCENLYLFGQNFENCDTLSVSHITFDLAMSKRPSGFSLFKE